MYEVEIAAGVSYIPPLELDFLKPVPAHAAAGGFNRFKTENNYNDIMPIIDVHQQEWMGGCCIMDQLSGDEIKDLSGLVGYSPYHQYSFINTILHCSAIIIYCLIAL